MTKPFLRIWKKKNEWNEEPKQKLGLEYKTKY